MRSTCQIQRSTTSSKNRNSKCFFKNGPIQTKLNINEPGDMYEQEADSIANKVMQTPASEAHSPFFQPKPIQTSSIQKKGSASLNLPTITPSVQQTLNSIGQPMDKSTRLFMEQRFGYDFGHVQVHNNSSAHQSAADINAKAYTSGNHIVFAKGQYKPQIDNGKRLLAHELTHVVQQNSSNDKLSLIQRDLLCYNTPQTNYENPGGGRGVSVVDKKSAEAGTIRLALDSLIKGGKIKEVKSKDGDKSWFAPDQNVQKADIELLLKAAGYSKYSELADAILDIHGEYIFTGESVYVVGTSLTPPKTGSPSIKRRETRSLTESEIHEAKRVFGSALKYPEVNIDENSSVYTVGGYVRTIGETIHFPGIVDDMPLLIHELTHVWQYQRGANLVGLALGAIDGTYNYGGAANLKMHWEGGKAFSEFTTEQQGDILQHYYETLLAKGNTSAFDGFVGQVRTGKENERRIVVIKPIEYGKIDWVKDSQDFRLKIEAEIISQLKIVLKDNDSRASGRAKKVIALFKSLGTYWYGTYIQRFIDKKSSDELINLIFSKLSYETRIKIYKAIFLDKKFWK